MTSFYRDLEFRGLIHQMTDLELGPLLDKGGLTLYCGFDPTADSLHIGHLLPILTLKRFQMAGHRPIAVVGGATGMIGDPSFKGNERSLLTPELLSQNVQGIHKQLSRFLDFSKALLVNNADWFQGVSYLDFLRDIGKHFTVNHMMAKESVRARLEDREHGISYTEFSYMLLQAYDFYKLQKMHSCNLQIGGSDQWGNITAGTELIRRMHAHTHAPAPLVYGLTMPLVMKADGSKFGKTESGNVWLDPEKTSPYQFYQFFLQTADSDVETYLKFFTFLSPVEINALLKSLKEEPEKREAQKRLAIEITVLVHGKAATDEALKASSALFSGDIDLKSVLKSMDKKSVLATFSGAPSTQKLKSTLSGLLLVDLLVETGLCPSKGQARKDIQSGGIYLNNERTQDATLALSMSHLVASSIIVLRKGKKNYHLVSFE